jgi:hypothetical protein
LLKLNCNVNKCKPLSGGNNGGGDGGGDDDSVDDGGGDGGSGDDSGGGSGSGDGGDDGRAVQFDPIKPTLKAPETKRLKLRYDGPLSNLAFKLNLCHHTTVTALATVATMEAAAATTTAAVTAVRRCRLTPSNPS